MSRHSRLKSSTTARMQKRRLSVRVSLRKSSDQRFGPWGKARGALVPSALLSPPQRRVHAGVVPLSPALPVGADRRLYDNGRLNEQAHKMRLGDGLLVDHRLSAIEQLAQQALLAGFVTGQHSFELLGQPLFRDRSRADSDPMVRAFRGRGPLWRGLASVIHRWALA
jgi:hypothetical protein